MYITGFTGNTWIMFMCTEVSMGKSTDERQECTPVLTCWKRISMSNVSGSLGLHTGGILNFSFGDTTQGTIFTV